MVEHAGHNQFSHTTIVLPRPGVVEDKDIAIFVNDSPISYRSTTHNVSLDMKSIDEIYIRTMAVFEVGLFGGMWKFNDTTTRVLRFRHQPYLMVFGWLEFSPMTLFPSKRDVISFVLETSVCDKKPFVVTRSDARRFAVECPDSTCDFILAFFRSDDGLSGCINQLTIHVTLLFRQSKIGGFVTKRGS